MQTVGRWAELAQSAQANGQCEFRYWDGVQCDATGLPFGETRCSKHEGKPSQV